jgi:hypothetical protein
VARRGAERVRERVRIADFCASSGHVGLAALAALRDGGADVEVVRGVGRYSSLLSGLLPYACALPNPPPPVR